MFPCHHAFCLVASNVSKLQVADSICSALGFGDDMVEICLFKAKYLFAAQGA